MCDLAKCKGACCVEGDLGAPLEKKELPILDRIYEHVKPFLTQEGISAIEDQGKYLLDSENEYSTPTIEGKECAYVFRENGILKCGIEKAYEAGKTDFRKPVSCHLYPIRISRLKEHDALNYDRWAICNPACVLGETQKVKLYEFAREALIRKYGHTWYDNFVKLIEEVKDDN